MAFHISARSSAICALLLAGCMSGDSTGSKFDLGTGQGTDNGGSTGTAATTAPLVTVTPLTGDAPGSAPSVLSPLVNAWGVVAFKGMFWIADNATGKVTIVDGAGKPADGMKGTPASDAIDLGEGITGVTTNDSTAMQIDHDDQNACGPAMLIFASEHSQLIGVNTDLSMTGGFVLVDRSDVMADYTGVATLDVKAMTNGGGTGPGTGTGGTGTGTGGTGTSGTGGTGTGGTGTTPAMSVLTLAADFHNARVDVFDESFNLLSTPAFVDSDIPAGFAPFNVMVSNDVVYVSYAQQNDTKDDSVAGAGLGFVVAFDVNGRMMWTAKGNELNAPWGMSINPDPAALIPSALVVGNFGDGHITTINAMDGTITGQLMDATKALVTIDGLWGLALGTGVTNAKPSGLYFAAGPGEEMHGMFGVITPATAPPPSM